MTNHLSGFHFADIFGVNQVERARLARENPGIAPGLFNGEFAQNQRAKAKGVPNPNQHILGHHRERVGAL